MRLRRIRSRKYTPWLVVAALLGGLVVADGAQARRRSRRKRIVLSEFVIEGRVQKPQAFLVLQRQNLNFEGLKLKKSFVPAIFESVKEKPF